MANISKLIDADKKHLATMEKLFKQHAATIFQMRAGRVKAPRRRTRKSTKKAFTRVIFGDVHGEVMDRAAVAAFMNDIEALQPREIICIGDVIDCGGFLSQHKVLGVVAELESTYEQDVDAGNMIFDEIARRCPNAAITLIEGNHEHRVNRWICDKVIGNPANARYLRDLFGPAKLLNLEKRGIRWVERHKYYDGLSVSGTIKMDPFAVAQHGEAFCGKNAPFRQLERLGHSVFFGHNHRLSVTYAENLDSALVAVNTGCLCQKRPIYGLTKTTDWQPGYISQFVEPGKGFLAVPVPIIDGLSFLPNALKQVGK